jgi:hypothetical protein
VLLPHDASIRLTARTITAPAADVIRLRVRAIACTCGAMDVITFPQPSAERMGRHVRQGRRLGSEWTFGGPGRPALVAGTYAP